MMTWDVRRPLFGHGIVRRKWTDLRQTSDSATAPSFKPWLMVEEPVRGGSHIADDPEFFKSREECRRIIGQYQKVQNVEIGRAHVCTPVTNAQLVCSLLLEKKKQTQRETQIINQHKYT